MASLKFVIFENGEKNQYCKFGDGFTVKSAKEAVEALGYKTIYAGASTEKTMNAIYNNRALWTSFIYLPQV